MNPAGTLPLVGVADVALAGLDDVALAGYRAHPVVLDSCIQVLIAMLGRTETRLCAFIPVQIDRVRSFAPLPAQVTCRLTVTRQTARSGSAEIEVYDTAGELLLSMHGAWFRKVDFQSSAPINYVTEGLAGRPGDGRRGRTGAAVADARRGAGGHRGRGGPGGGRRLGRHRPADRRLCLRSAARIGRRGWSLPTGATAAAPTGIAVASRAARAPDRDGGGRWRAGAGGWTLALVERSRGDRSGNALA